MNTNTLGGGRNRRLVLHFDINNTILMKDSSKDIKSVQLNVSQILLLVVLYKIMFIY